MIWTCKDCGTEHDSIVGESPDVTGFGFKAIGYSYPCDGCGSKNTYFSAKYSNWMCYDCGKLFQAPKVCKHCLELRQAELRQADSVRRSITDKIVAEMLMERGIK